MTTVIVTLALIFAIGETVVRLTRPMPYLYPRYKYLPDYGFGLYPNARMVHGFPGKYKFYYTINANGHRGPAVPVSPTYEKRNVVVLGDSWSFGQGVNDGFEYPAVLQDSLGNGYAVINLGNPGWGLTQQIRRYYEFGRLYKPAYVILQYCHNDPTDNLQNKVTILENGEFKFVPSTSSADKFKRYLSHSIVQKSQLYNFFKVRAFEFLQNRQVASEEKKQQTPAREGGPLPRHVFYCELLEKFAEELRRDGVTLVFMAVEKQLREHQHVAQCVSELKNNGYLVQLDLDVLFAGVPKNSLFYSPDGHWGEWPHQKIGTELAALIKARDGAGLTN